MRTGKNRDTGLYNTEVDHEETSNHENQDPSPNQHQATWNRQDDTATCDKISGQRSINRRSLDQHSGQHR